MTKKQKVLAICDILKKIYPEAICQLNADTPFQLLVATRLSAQCTDARVNMVTPALFEKYPTENQLAEAELFAFDFAGGGDDTAHQLLLGHFQTEDCNTFILSNRYILCNVKNERCFPH